MEDAEELKRKAVEIIESLSNKELLTFIVAYLSALKEESV